MTYALDESRTATSWTPGTQAGRGAPTEIVIHHWGVDGQSHDGVVSFFCAPGTQTSPHYVASAGRVSCLVAIRDVAWHAGVWAVNVRSIGIECRPEATDADYATIAELIRDLRKVYGDLPLHPHRLYVQTDCPGRYDLARLDALARAATAGQSTSATPIKETTLSAAEVAAINAHTDAAKNQVIAYIQSVLTIGWRNDGVNTHPGVAIVAEQNQRDIRALAKTLTAAPAALTDAQVQQIIAALPAATLDAFKAQINK